MRTITLGQAKDLFELGFKRGSFFYFHYDPIHGPIDQSRYYLTNHGFYGDYPAYTMDELWGFMPEQLFIDENDCYLTLTPNVCCYQWDISGNIIDHYGSTDDKDDILTAIYSTLKWLIQKHYIEL